MFNTMVPELVLVNVPAEYETGTVPYDLYTPLAKRIVVMLDAPMLCVALL